MKKANNIMGKMDYFSSIDRLANDFIPKTKTPLSVGNYDYIGVFSPPTKRKYNPYKQEMNFLPPKKRFDPYENTWGRQVQQILHVGPAQSKELNSKQIKELIHELKEKKLRDRKIVEETSEIKNLSKKFMNKPWNAVPERYRKKYGNMDFDGDGVKNSEDCYPFDYDRQANILTGTSSSYFKTSTPAPVVKQSVAPTPAKSSAPATTTTYKTPTGNTITSPVTTTKSSSGTTVYSYNYTTPSGQTMSTSTTTPPITVAAPTTTSGGNIGTTSSQPKMYYMNADGSRGAEIPAEKPGTMVTTQSFGGGQITSQVQSDGTLKVISTKEGQLPYPGYTFGTGSSKPAELTITPQLSDIERTLMDYVYKYNIPGTGAMIDSAKQQQLYEDILYGRITDPGFKAALEAVMGPATTDYLNQKFNINKDYQKQQKMLDSVIQRKIKDIQLVGGQNIANKYAIARSQDILQGRANMLDKAKQAREIAAENAYNVKKSGIAMSETEKRASEYTIPGTSSSQGSINVPKGTLIANLSPEIQKAYAGYLTSSEKNQYDKLHR